MLSPGPQAHSEIVELDNLPAQIYFHELIKYLIRQSLGCSGVNGGVIHQGQQKLLLKIKTRIYQIPGNPVRNYMCFLWEVAIAEGVVTMVVRVEKIVGRVATGERFYIRQYFPCHIFVDVRINHKNTVIADNDA